MIITAAMVWSIVILVYLIDCVVLLECGQSVLEWTQDGWHARFGAVRYTIAGRSVLVLNPLTPWRTIVRSQPLLAPPLIGGMAPSVIARALSPFGVLQLSQAILVLAILPWLMYRAPGWPFLTAFVLAYVNALILLGMIWLLRARLAISASALGWHSVYALVCLPLSVNVVRKAGLMPQIDGDAWRLVRLLRGNARDVALRELEDHVEEVRLGIEDGTEAAARFDRLKAAIEERRAQYVGA